MPHHTLDDLFPPPSPAPSTIAPSHWPGTSPESVATLRKVLKDNHKKWHIFFNEKRFHNHAAHRAIAIWALGADGAVIQAGYDKDCNYELPAFDSPGDITADNWKDHLGDEKYYKAYLAFFTDAVQLKGTSAALEQYLFSEGANRDPSIDSDEKQPQMFTRLLSGLLHPLIHVGYGVEFGNPGMVIEGLAQTAVHLPDSVEIAPSGGFGSDIAQFIDAAASKLASTHLREDSSQSRSHTPGTHAFSILARVLKDPRFVAEDIDQTDYFADTLKKHGDALKEYAGQWTLDPTDPKALRHKLEELAWANVIIYGIGGWKEGNFNADFFYMHLVTSSLFLPSLIAVLSVPSQVLLLRSHFAVSLALWVSRGRPSFPIKAYFDDPDLAFPKPFGPLPTPDKSALPSPSSPYAVTPNPWLPIIATSIVHPDEHIAKLQRALVHYSSLYGARAQGEPDFKGTELEGAEWLDGTLFVRVAGLSAKRMGRVAEGEKEGAFWDRTGFWKNKVGTGTLEGEGLVGGVRKEGFGRGF